MAFESLLEIWMKKGKVDAWVTNSIDLPMLNLLNLIGGENELEVV